MKTDDKNKWKEATLPELQEQIRERTEKLFAMRNQLRLGQMKDYSAISKARRDIARFRTYILNKQRASGAKHVDQVK